MHSISQHECNENAQNKKSVNAFHATKEQPSRTVVHAKLEMTTPDSPEEVEADAVANDIVQGGKIARSIFAGGVGDGISVSSQMEGRLNSMQGGGQVMPDGLRNMMERGFNHDFSQVRLHTDSEAASLSSSIHAKAFTHGNDIYFNQGQFSPNTSEGQKLMAHELTHVVQGAGKVGKKNEYDSPASNDFCNVRWLDCSGHHFLLTNDERYIVDSDMKLAKKMVSASLDYIQSTNIEDPMVRKHFGKITEGSFKRIERYYKAINDALSGAKIRFFKDNNPTQEKRRWFAYTFPSDGMIGIAITDDYFYKPKKERASILIHELSHEVAYTNRDYQNPNDLNYKYRQEYYGEDALELAKRNQNYATHNASNYQLFALNYYKLFKK